MSVAVLPRTVVPILVLVFVAASNTACQSAFINHSMAERAWRLDDDRIVVAERESQSYALNTKDRALNYDQGRFKLLGPKGHSRLLYSMRCEGGGGSDSGVDLASLEVRTDAQKQRLWFVDTEEKRVVFSFALGEDHRVQLGPQSAIWRNLNGTSTLQPLERFEHTTDRGIRAISLRQPSTGNATASGEANEIPGDPGS